MNRYDERDMAGKEVISDRCIFCGRPSTEQHHVVYKSHGGTKGPTIPVCGWGNASGCHGMLHHGLLHVRWNEKLERWEACQFKKPTKKDVAEARGDWVPLRMPAERRTFGTGRPCRG